MPTNILKELKIRKAMHPVMPEIIGVDHSAKLNKLYSHFKKNNTNKLILLNFVLNYFDFNIISEVYRTILKQSFGIFPIENISQKEGAYFFTSLGSRPHIPMETEISILEYFKKHDKYFGTNVLSLLDSTFRNNEGESVPPHHVIWMLEKDQVINWVNFREFNTVKKMTVLRRFSEKLTNSLFFLNQFGNVKISIAIGYNGERHKLANCQSLATIHMHAYVVAEKPTIRKVVPTNSQKSMYLNTYLILAGTLKKQLSALIKNSFRIVEDVKVISTENSKDLFNQIRFDFKFKKAKSIEIVLFAVSELEKNLGELWRCFYTNKPLDETFNKSLITKVRRYLQNPNVRKDIPDVPGFIVVLKLDHNNKVLGVKLAPAKHGPTEGQLGGILKLQETI